jgi:hypothetical protein
MAESPPEINRPHPQPGGAGFLNCAVALAAFVAACAFIHRVAPFPDVPEVSPKLEYFTQHGGEFDAIFVGSSRIYHHVSPELFDRAVAAEHGPMRSFNFGIDALYPPQSFYVIDKILERKPRRLKWVFVELTPVTLQIEHGQRQTIRAVYWHDWERTKLACAAALSQRVFWRRGLWELLGSHAELFLENYGNIGRGVELLEKMTAPKKRRPFGKWQTRWLGPAHDGFDPEPDAPPMAGPALAGYEKRLAKLKSATTKPAPASPLTDDAFAALAKRIKRAGASPVFVIPPTAQMPQALFAGRDGAAVLAFDDPIRFPTLYQLDHRQDFEHLNPAGAAEFTRLLAERFTQSLAEKR